MKLYTTFKYQVNNNLKINKIKSDKSRIKKNFYY